MSRPVKTLAVWGDRESSEGIWMGMILSPQSPISWSWSKRDLKEVRNTLLLEEGAISACYPASWKVLCSP